MSNIQDLLENQHQLMEAMEQLLRNFKKDSTERKTPSYIKKRLETLEMYWSEFQVNHVSLCEYEERDYAYFSENHYKRTNQLYNEARVIIQQAKVPSSNPQKRDKSPVVSTVQTKQDQHPGETSVYPEHSAGEKSSMPTKTISQGNASKYEEMLRKQASNFKAFSRTVANINLEKINERWEFEDTLKNLESRWKAIDSLHWEIDSEVIGEGFEYEENFNKHERQYNVMKKSINSKMWSVAHRVNSTPQIELPTFSGTYQTWTSFKDLFNETIHSNPSLSCAQKMQFLKSKVKGEAEKLIQHLSISSDNYEVCWEILNNRYNNKKQIFTAYLNTILNLPTMQYQTSTAVKRVHDTAKECLNAMQNMGVNISTWDPILVHLLAQKLDTDTYNDYIDSIKEPRELPSLVDFFNYLESKFISLEAARRKQELIPQRYQQQRGPPPNNRQQHIYKAFSANQNFNSKPKILKNYSNNYTNNTMKKSSQTASNIKCPLCSNEHGLFHCNEFVKLHLNERRNFIRNHNLCNNCSFDHKGKECKSEKRCRQCHTHHHTLLHDTSVNIASSNKLPSNNGNATTSSSHVSMEDISETLLATAQLKVKTNDGSEIVLRALIDQGSQISLITENAAQILGLPRKRCKGIIFGVGARENNCKGAITITCSSIHSSYTFDTDVYVMRNLINNLPNKTFSKPSTWNYLEGIQLADPKFHISRPIDILFGADVYSNIILGGIIKANEAQPIAQQSHLGWILCGNMKSYQCNVVLNNLEDIRRFWAIEDIDENSQMTSEDTHCLQQYKTETKRQEDGRYIVRLPLHSDVDQKLGESKAKASAQFFQLEKKFKTSEKTAKEYKLFMAEYLELHHMQLCVSKNEPSYYLPHHCVRRADSLTTDLRVVFNASSKTSSGHSLNDLMYSGPNLQSDLLSIILKWRQYRIAVTADIEKMFRQILCHEDDRRYQKILWRESAHQPIREYALSTVTYGTKAAPFLAMMTLKQLASDEKHNYPEAAAILESSFYMDDLLWSCDDLEQATRVKTDLTNLLKSGGFNLRKWLSNNLVLLEDYKSLNEQPRSYSFLHQQTTKTLGLHWNPINDNFTFQLTINPKSSKPVTKRFLLSEISKIFDPLGWLSPVTTNLKLIFQKVWHQELQWDDEVPEAIKKEWSKIKFELNEINLIQIPRWIQFTQKDDIELHGFCDSSENAYACVIYSKSKHHPSEVVIVAAKSRLVPAKKTFTIPKLELCSALLLSTLMKKVRKSLDSSHNITIHGWSDSTAVLGWLHGDHRRWKQFVSNRITNIIQTMPVSCWHYVKSSENPADCASRGILPSQLREHRLWWHGPEWLREYVSETEKEVKSYYETKEELKKIQINVTTQRPNYDVIENILTRHSCITRVIRIVAWMFRAVSRCSNRPNYLTYPEIIHARNVILKHIQINSFEKDISNLEQRKEVDRKSKLLSLNPFLDKEGLLRVGGRLNNANIDQDQKHPIIVPHDGHFTELLIDQAHKMTYHGGTRLTLAKLRRQYWIIGGNRAVKKQIYNCVKCRRHNPIKQCQLMGDLPTARCNSTRPFYNTGVDYTGYIDVKTNKGRGVKTTKGYVAVFICMVTKAVHLELVSDLSSSAFLSALRRLAARRGAPRHMFSDNGTNFVGANKILKQETVELKKILDPDFFSAIAEMQIEWHFNAPSWPSAGGLWEAAVKSLKYHLRRVIGEQKLTYEELLTLLAQLEACLNSRPLSALTEDPEDIDYLTPSHFLSSGPNLTIIETETDERTRWQLVQKIFKDTWKRWQSEYLCQLSSRGKWKQSQENICIDDIVVIHDTNLPAGKWALGKVIDLHPGKDGYVRVVTVKTKNGTLKRPITKLSKLPVTNQDKTKADKTEEDQHVKNPKRKGRKNTLCNLVWTILCAFSIVTPAQCNYNLYKINSNQSVYFDKITDMHILRDEWKLIVYYDMDPYWQGVQILKNYITSLNKACFNAEQRNQCGVILLQLRHGFNELTYYSNMLLSKQIKRHRKGRGLINGVGYIANSLFGILDEQFAEQYEKDISLIKENENHLLLLWKNQTSVVEAENNLLKRCQETIETQNKMYNKHINELEKAVNIIAIEVQNTENINDITMMSIVANSLLVHLKNLQETLLDTITEIHYGKFNIHLLSPKQLEAELNIISGQLPKDAMLPIENIQDLRKLYHLLKVKTRLTMKHFIFEIKIPLVTRDNYEIYKLVPVPQKIQESMVSIMPIAEHIAINLQKDAYVPLIDNELQTCIPYNMETYMCPLRRPIYRLKSDDNLCIKNINTNQCETKQTECADMWTYLNKINTYLYFCCEQCIIKIICEHQVTARRVSKAGIIAIAEGCVIKGETFTIYSHTQQSNSLNLQPDVLKVDVPAINNIFNITVPTTENNVSGEDQIESYAKQLNAIDQQIELMKSEESKGLSDPISSHDVHQYVVLYLLVCAAIATSVILLWCRWRSHFFTTVPNTSSESQRPTESGIQLVQLQRTPLRHTIAPGRSAVTEDPSSRMSHHYARVNKATSPITKKLFSDSDNS